MSVISIIVPMIVSAVLTALMVPLIIRVSYKKNLFDTIDERTVHTDVVPRLGGSAFVLSVIVAMLVGIFMAGEDSQKVADAFLAKSNGVHNPTLQFWALIGAVMVIYLAGLWDDIRQIDYKKKFFCQLISALLIVVVGGFWINDFYGLFGLHQLPPVVGKAFSVLLIMFITNAFNLIDGIDGLAASLGMITLCVIGAVSLASGQFLMAVLSLALTASLAVFFCYNKFGSIRHYTKIFMGDGGSQTMGLIVASLVVFVAMKNPNSDDYGLLLQSPVIFFCLIVIPCFDAIRVMICRMKNGKNPFLPDKTHIHHKFLCIGFSTTQTLLVILLLDIIFVLLNVALYMININIDADLKINLILALDIVIWCVVDRWLDCRVRRTKVRK